MTMGTKSILLNFIEKPTLDTFPHLFYSKDKLSQDTFEIYMLVYLSSSYNEMSLCS